MGENYIGMIITTEGPIMASTDVIGVTATVLIPRIGGVMIITQITESIAITEELTGVITVITGTEVTLTIQTIANTEITEITEATGISTRTEITEVMESVVDTESMETMDIKEGRRYTPQAECPREHRTGHMLVKCLWRERLSSIPTPFLTTDDRGQITQFHILCDTGMMKLTLVAGYRHSMFEGAVFLHKYS